MNFFTYGDKLPETSGYRLFHAGHILLMVLCMAICIGCVYYYRRCDEVQKKTFRRIMSGLIIALIAIRLLYVCLCKADIIYDLPLHLCSIAGIFCFIYERGYEVLPGAFRSALEQTMFSLFLPGAVMAIVFSDGTMYPLFHFITFQSNLYHALVVAYIIIKITDGNVRPDIRQGYKSLLFLALIVPPVYIFDRIFRANYMFLLAPSLGSPFTGIYTEYGYPGYMLCYALTVMLEIAAINLIGSVALRTENN
ncbi:MAG: YwaF family protein [Lachnospiraceae bacterium]|nr:YwaF family protein [Lachnospiraceae bacterium]